jgi:cellobiose phosphorylase
VEPADIRPLLLDNFAGVRVDGSNATIIGHRPGEFIADRNQVPRVWMDHGAWPLVATRLYIDQTGDLSFLLEEQVYFQDMHTHRCTARDPQWTEQGGTVLRTRGGEVYRGSVCEHLLIQHATAFFNVGDHNNIRLEGADWNDGLDMAGHRGESVAFTALYAANLICLGRLLERLEQRDRMRELRLARECLLLLDTLDRPVDYNAPEDKRAALARYLDGCASGLSGETVHVPSQDVARDLRRKGQWILDHLRADEWITNPEGHGWFNGYYDDDGHRVEGDHPNGVRMTLPGQVFTTLGGAATDVQVTEIIKSVDRYLWDESAGGCRLNSDFREVPMNLGRCYGFAFGHKENGAVFCHMAVMYAYALYHRGRPAEGHRVLDAIYRQCMNFPVSRIYPGIPEYFNARGRGMYHYLTGSASWYVLTVLTEAFGVRGELGDLCIHPQLRSCQFDDRGRASVQTRFAGRRIRVVYDNPGRLESGAYRIAHIRYAQGDVPFARHNSAAIVRRDVIRQLEADKIHELLVALE